MTTTDMINREIDEITHRTGRYIAPYRLANLMKTANRIMDLIVKSDVAMTYEEIKLVLGIVDNTVGRAIGAIQE